MAKSTRFIVLKVEVDHEDDADVTAICEEVKVFYDAEDGSILKSKVVQVRQELPKPEPQEGWLPVRWIK